MGIVEDEHGIIWFTWDKAMLLDEGGKKLKLLLKSLFKTI